MELPKPLVTVTTLSKVLAGILFVLLPFIGFYLGTKYQISLSPKVTETPTVTTTPAQTPTPADPTADWKTYTSDVFAFTIKYPSDWELSEKGAPPYASQLQLRPISNNPLNKFQDFGLVTIDVSKGNISSLDEAIEKTICDQTAKIKCDLNKVQQINISGFPAKRIQSTFVYSSDNVVVIKPIEDKLFKSLEIIFKLRLDNPYKDNITPEEKEKIFNQILSTFRFTK